MIECFYCSCKKRYLERATVVLKLGFVVNVHLYLPFFRDRTEFVF